MRRAPLAVLALILAVSLKAWCAHADQLKVMGPARGAQAVQQPVFPLDVPEITARISLTISQKTRIELKWIDPSGGLYLRTLKTVFPSRGAGAATVADVLEVAGKPASNMPGWWVVEAYASGNRSSARFLLTGSSRVLSIASGENKDRLAMLRAAGPGDPDIRDMAAVAMAGPDDEVRAAVAEPLARVTDGWAADMLRQGQEDASPSVRVVYLRALVARGGKDSTGAAVRAASDDSPMVRRAVADISQAVDDEAAAGILGKLIQDQDKAVRAASLGALSRREAPGFMDALAGGLKVEDHDFRVAVIDTVASRSGQGKAAALAACLSVADPDIRSRALDVIARDKVGGVTDAVRPLADDQDAAVAGKALEIIVRDKDTPGAELALRSRHLAVRKDALKYLTGLSGGSGGAGVAAALGDEDPGIRSAAFAYFIRRGGPGLAEILEKTACDKDPDIRAACLAQLATMHGEESSRALRAYMACGDAGVRQAIADILAGRSDKAAMEALTASLADEDARVRLKAATRLLALGVTAPLAGLASDNDPLVRKVALKAMRRSADPATLPALKERLKNGEEGERLEALEALGGLPGEEPSTAIAGAVIDGSGQVSGLARKLLLMRRDGGALDGLCGLYLSGPPEMRKDAFGAIAAIPGKGAEEALLNIYPSSSPEEKASVLKTLSLRKSYLLPGTLVTALSDESIKVRATAVDIARSLSEGRAGEFYRAAASSGYNDVREAGLEWFKGGRDDESKAVLYKELNDTDPELRKRALSYLVTLGDPGLPARLPRLAQDEDPGVRLVAYNAALKLKDPREKADTLVPVAGGPDPELARAALDALLPMDDGRALPFYIKAFNDGYNRREFVLGMARLKGDGASDALAMAYDGSADDEEIRLISVRALEGRGKGALPALTKAMSDKSPRVRRAALAALKGMEGIEAFRLMLPALEDPLLREEAFQALTARSDPEEMEQFARFATGINDAHLRGRVFDSLEKNGLPTPLVAGFAMDTDPGIRKRALVALSGRGGPEPVYSLILFGAGGEGHSLPAGRALLQKRPEDIRGGIDLLFERGRAKEAELKFLTGTLKDPELLAYIVGRIPPGDEKLLTAALDPVASRRSSYDVSAIMAGMKASGGPGRVSLARALASAGGQDTGRYLTEAYSLYPDIRGELIRSSGENGRVRSIMAQALKDGDVANRRLAAGYLGRTEEDELLALAMRDADGQVRLEAARAALTPPNAAILEVAATDPSREVRMTAASGLGGLSGEKAVGLLTTLATDREPEVSGEAVSSLTRLGDGVPSSSWTGIAENVSAAKETRLRAVSMLAGRKGAVPAEAMARLLFDPEPGVRDAARAGIRANATDSLPALYPLIKDPGKRTEVLGLLMEIGDGSSEAPVLAELPHMDEEGRLTAVAALGKFGGREGLPVMSGCYRDGPGVMKNAVVKALGGMKLTGSEPEVVAMLSDAIVNGPPAMRANAARAAGSLKAAGLKPLMEKSLAAERSTLVKDELKKALAALSSSR